MSELLELSHEAVIEDDWYRYGACQTNPVDPELFYPEGRPGSPAYDKQVAEALSYCGDCPVRVACLLWAVESFQEHGVWGGTEENERVQMMRAARQAGTLATNRYLTNSEVADVINKLLEQERARQQRIAEQDREARKRKQL